MLINESVRVIDDSC